MARQATIGLGEDHLADIAQALSAGGKPPRVVLRESSAGLPAGTAGTVVRLADRSTTDEFVVVRVNNDELPFTPAELAPPPPRQPRRPKDATGSGKAAGQSADDSRRAGGLKAVGPDQRAASGPKAAGPTQESRDRLPTGPKSVPTPADPPARSGGPKAAGPAQNAGPARSTRTGSGRGAGRRGTAKLSVTVSYDDRGWTLEASRGARSLIKATPIGPKAALRITELLDDDQVREAVAEIIETERQEAVRRADELRAQLAEVEAVLADFGD